MAPLTRHVLPVEDLTSSTRLLLVVHQFGFDQRLERIWEVCRAKGLAYVEDSPGGVHETERVGPGSWGRFISLTKVLPILKGALFLTQEARLAALMRQRRQRGSAPAAALLAAWLIATRWPRRMPRHARWGDVMSEVSFQVQGALGFFRANIRRGLEQWAAYAACAQQRLQLVEESLGPRALLPDTRRLPSLVALPASEGSTTLTDCLRAHGFDAARYHVDVHRNMLDPAYRPMVLIPLNRTVPQLVFESLIRSLAAATPSLGACDERAVAVEMVADHAH